MVDAVPRGGKVHFILQEGVTGVPYLEKRGIKAEPVPSTLEDGFMILLKKAEEDSLPFPKLVDPLIRKRCPALGT